MVRGRGEISPNSRTYGFPLYCAGWVPLSKISQIVEKPNQEEGGGVDNSLRSDPGERNLIVVLAGGGGEGHSGIPNALVLSQCDFASRSLSDQPLFKLGTNDELPYRLVVHPGGDGILCSFLKGCRWFEWNFQEDVKLALMSSERSLTQLEDLGLQLTLAFNADGTILGTGGEDGHLRVYKWPSLEVILDQADAHTTLKDLSFSNDGKYLSSLGSSGPCRIWDLTSSTVAASLPREDGELFGFCKFSHTADGDLILYITAMHGKKWTIISWSPKSWARIGRKEISRDSVTAFNVSSDGKFLAIGTDEGGVTLISSEGLKLQRHIRKAHLGIVTALLFSEDSRSVFFPAPWFLNLLTWLPLTNLGFLKKKETPSCAFNQA